MKRLAALLLLGSTLACNGSVDDLAVTAEVDGGGANASAAPGSTSGDEAQAEATDHGEGSVGADAAGDEATMPAVHFVITGDDGAAWPLGGDGASSRTAASRSNDSSARAPANGWPSA
ncbi:MAG: hypothetical protein JST00_33505 [Deltaproteobacteria bacterium]|nr:hypothetical protein [Deltaproteobacteria bacterium]